MQVNMDRCILKLWDVFKDVIAGLAFASGLILIVKSKDLSDIILGVPLFIIGNLIIIKIIKQEVEKDQ